VVHSAEVLARGIWQNGGKTRAELVPDRANPTVIEPFIAYGVEQGWLDVDGNQVRRGAVNPIPMTAVGDERSPAWGGLLRG
jgi:hypothetical protein